jgi:hypothetical protein
MQAIQDDTSGNRPYIVTDRLPAMAIGTIYAV